MNTPVSRKMTIQLEGKTISVNGRLALLIGLVLEQADLVTEWEAGEFYLTWKCNSVKGKVSKAI